MSTLVKYKHRKLVLVCAIVKLLVLFQSSIVSGDPPGDGNVLKNSRNHQHQYEILGAYKIAPKPCSINSIAGTCMFVWECRKSEGKHLGICVDGFMFGSCCGHNETSNDLGESSIGTTSGSSLSFSNHNNHHHAIITHLTSTTTQRPTTTTMQSFNNNYHESKTSTSSAPTTSTRKPVIINNNWATMDSSSSSSEEEVKFPFITSKNASSTSTTIKTTTTLRPRPTMPTSTVSTTTTSTSTTTMPTIAPSTIFIDLSEPPTSAPTQPPPSQSGSGSFPEEVIDCGIAPLQPQKRIVGGKESTLGVFPWIASIRRTSFFGFSSTHRCGGAILNSHWVATAGHCVDDLLTTQIRVRLGEWDFSGTDKKYPHIEKTVTKKVVHPSYNFFTYENDLALLKLETPLTFTKHIRPICLPGNQDLLIGENATVAGWGRLTENGQLPSRLQQVTVPIISNQHCREMFLKSNRVEHIPDIFICAGYEKGGQDSCQGDSGGPLQVKGRDGRWFLGGIISWGIGCAEANMPGVCTRISKFTEWIMNQVT